MQLTVSQACPLTPKTGSSLAGSASGISDLLVAHQLTGGIWWRVMQADSVLTFNSASSLVEFVCEFLKYKCAAAIWICAKHTHTHALEKLHVQAGELRAILTLPPASQSLFVKISHTHTSVGRNNIVTM